MASVVDKDLGYRDMFAELTAGDVSVFVGVRGGATYPDGTSIVVVATVNEFGSADGRIPERSFLRSTMREQRGKYGRQLQADFGRLVDGKLTKRQVFARLGLVAVADVQRKIVALRQPPNAASTIARKRSSNPLIDESELLQSIDFVVQTRGVR